jgi:transcriptional regulator GlxA family with amidase domain
VRRDLGAGIAVRNSRLAVMPLERAGGQAQFIVHEPPGIHDSNAIGPLLVWIEQNLKKGTLFAKGCTPSGDEHQNAE